MTGPRIIHLENKRISINGITYKYHTKIVRKESETENDHVLKVSRRRDSIRVTYLPAKTWVIEEIKKGEVIESSIYIECI